MFGTGVGTGGNKQLPWHRSRRIGGHPAAPLPAHFVEHEQRVDDFLRAANTVRTRSKKQRAERKERAHIRAEVRFKKLPDGQWGIIGQRHLLVPGRIVSVTKKGGKVCPVTVGRIVKTDYEWALATVAKEGKE